MMWGGRKSSRRIYGVHNTDEESNSQEGKTGNVGGGGIGFWVGVEV